MGFCFYFFIFFGGGGGWLNNLHLSINNIPNMHSPCLESFLLIFTIQLRIEIRCIVSCRLALFTQYQAETSQARQAQMYSAPY